MYHITKDGKKIRIEELDTAHLNSIINWIKRKAQEGLTVRYGGGSCAEDIWYDEETLFGDDALKALNYNAYKNELNKRKTL